MIRRRNVYNPPAHLVDALDDWLAGEAARDPAGALAQYLAGPAPDPRLAAAEALDVAYAEAEAFDAARAGPEPSADDLDGAPEDMDKIAGDRR